MSGGFDATESEVVAEFLALADNRVSEQALAENRGSRARWIR
jgi:hypothetical protein